MESSANDQPSINVESGRQRYNIGGDTPRRNAATTTRDSGRDAGATESAASADGGFGQAFPPSVDTPKRGRRSKAVDIASANGAAEMCVGLVETIGVMRYQTAGKMLPNERGAISQGLSSTFQQMPPSVTGEINRLSAPVFAAVGLLLYLGRMAGNERQLRATRSEDTHVARASQIIAQQQAAQGRANGTQTDATTQQVFDPSQVKPANIDDLADLMGGS